MTAMVFQLLCPECGGACKLWRITKECELLVCRSCTAIHTWEQVVPVNE